MFYSFSHCDWFTASFDEHVENKTLDHEKKNMIPISLEGKGVSMEVHVGCITFPLSSIKVPRNSHGVPRQGCSVEFP